MFSKILLVLTAATIVVNAQVPTGIPGLTPCVIACIGPAAKTNGCAFTDPQCVCQSAQFQADAGACLQKNCSPSDVAGALALQTAQCSAAGLSATGTATTTNVVSFTLPASATTTGTTTPTSTSPSSTTSTGSASSLIVNGGAIAAMLAGILAL
ncbi:hypothetical protein B0H34DRAFT_796415 [Crassisporium funariophilum]|nr:hypothetical protein B0H34DRAFT_796415 [Crassisporium funariophilum]